MKTALLTIAVAATLVAQDGATGQNWPHYGGTQRFWRYSALDQINRANVSRLAPRLDI